jgi:hypothetical protein
VNALVVNCTDEQVKAKSGVIYQKVLRALLNYELKEEVYDKLLELYC